MALAAGTLAAGAVRAELDACDAAAPARARLTVVVEGVRSSDGLMAFTLYPDDPKRFLVHRGQIGVLRTPAAAGATRICIALPDAGVYSMVVYHDADGDHRFNRSAIGLPAEGYGFSNNPPSLLGLPSFKSTRFRTQAGDNTVRVRLHYPGG